MSNKKIILEGDNGASGTKTMMVDFPSNSHKSKTEEVPPVEGRVKKERVVSSQVIQKKPSFIKKLVDTFIVDDIGSVSSYIVEDVLIPAAKATIEDVFNTGISMLFNGRGTRTTRRGLGGASKISYNQYYKPESERREITRSARAAHQFDNVIIPSRGEAEDVLSRLIDFTEDYGQATVADFYDLVGITSEYTDTKYGWVNLSTAVIRRTGPGYTVELPKTIVLE